VRSEVLIKTDLRSRGMEGAARNRTTGLEAIDCDQCGDSGGAFSSTDGAPLREPIAFKEIQDLFQDRLNPGLIRLIARLTGVRLHIWWHGPLDFPMAGQTVTGCPAESQRQARVCECCLQGRWSAALAGAKSEQRFFGKCGLTNFCASLQVDKACPVTLVLQARVVPSPGRRWKSAAAAVSPADFRHAIALVRLVRCDLESLARAWKSGRELDQALRRLNHAEIEVTRWRGELQQRLPGLPEGGVQPEGRSRAQKLVARMLEYVQQNSQRPLSLGELAAAFKMNASYLSDVFRQTTGVTFHHFVQETRLAKARELLCDPRNRVCEVAGAAGYASPDAFRHAFKAHTGVSPEAWRAGTQGGPAGKGKQQ